MDLRGVKMKDKIKKIVDFYGIESQARQTMEECAELIQALNKYLRVSGENRPASEKTAAIMSIAEEIADVQVTICQIKEYFQLEKEVAEIIKSKIDRTIEKMNENKERFTMYNYFKENLSNEETGSYISYGIKTDDGSQSISDVSINESVVAKIVRKLNKGKVSPIHMKDVIEDELYQYE